MDLWTILRRAGDETPDRPAVIDGKVRLTYAEARDRAAALGDRLRKRGVEPGDRVAIREPNTHRFFLAYYASAAIGAVLVPLNTRLSEREAEEILEDAGVRILLSGEDFEGLAAAAPGAARSFDPAPVSPDDTAQLYYTSGTTGRPKGVMLTHRNVVRHAEAAALELGLSGEDVWGHIAPMFHLADAWAVFAITLVGGAHVMVPRFDAPSVLLAIEEHRITLSNLVPTMLARLVAHPEAGRRDLRSLRLILSGGAPIAPGLVRRTIETLGCEYLQTYGMTETSPYLTLGVLPEDLRRLPLPERARYLARTGRPFRGVELRVLRPDGTPVAADDREVGEIHVRGETVTPGYWNRPEETAAAFREGWLATGDLAVVDEHGLVNIVDRAKDMIVTGGENVFSIEVENVLFEHPAVLEAAVVGVPDEEWGEAVTAAVVLRPGAPTGEGEIRAFCRERLAGYKVPKRVLFLPDLPKTGSGKVSKRVLRARLRDGAG